MADDARTEILAAISGWTHRSTLAPTRPAALSTMFAGNRSARMTVSGCRRLTTQLQNARPSVRNFFGHRGQDTARKAAGVGRNYGKPGHLHPAELCVAFAPGRPQSIIRDWAADLREIMKLAAA